jgi:hypothetical protein
MPHCVNRGRECQTAVRQGGNFQSSQRGQLWTVIDIPRLPAGRSGVWCQASTAPGGAVVVTAAEGEQSPRNAQWPVGAATVGISTIRAPGMHRASGAINRRRDEWGASQESPPSEQTPRRYIARASDPIGSQGGSTTGSVARTSRSLGGKYFSSTTISNMYSSNQRSDITK